jgi:cell division protein ZapA
MPQVALTLNGRVYRFVCDEGEEAHFSAIADYLAAKAQSVREQHGKIGDDRLLAMTAVLLTDELFEMRARLAQAEEANKLAEARAAARRVARSAPGARPEAPQVTAQAAPGADEPEGADGDAAGRIA